MQARLQKLLLSLNTAKTLQGDSQQQAADKAKDLELAQVQKENLLAQQAGAPLWHARAGRREQTIMTNSAGLSYVQPVSRLHDTARVDNMRC